MRRLLTPGGFHRGSYRRLRDTLRPGIESYGLKVYDDVPPPPPLINRPMHTMSGEWLDPAVCPKDGTAKCWDEQQEPVRAASVYPDYCYGLRRLWSRLLVQSLFVAARTVLLVVVAGGFAGWIRMKRRNARLPILPCDASIFMIFIPQSPFAFSLKTARETSP